MGLSRFLLRQTLAKAAWATAATLVLASPQALAKELSVNELRQIQAKMRAYDTLTVDFVQSRYSDVRKKSSHREGKAQFAKPNLFRWMLETPKREYKIFDGKSFFDLNPDDNTATKYLTTGPQVQELSQMIDLVLNFDALLKRYEVTKAETVGDLIKIQLKPKAGAGDVTGVELHFAQKEEFVSYLKMDIGKNSLTHEFKNPSHAAIPEATFALPKGVKVSTSN